MASRLTRSLQNSQLQKDCYFSDLIFFGFWILDSLQRVGSCMTRQKGLELKTQTLTLAKFQFNTRLVIRDSLEHTYIHTPMNMYVSG